MFDLKSQFGAAFLLFGSHLNFKFVDRMPRSKVGASTSVVAYPT
jgi:hypothetical protein